MSAGVYSILHVPTGRRYVGSSCNVERRLSDHRKRLRYEARECPPKLLAAWRVGRPEDFEFKTLLLCAPEHLLMYEQRLIDGFDAANSGFNTHPRAGTPQGCKMPAWFRDFAREMKTGSTHSPQARAKIAEANRRRAAQSVATREKRGKVTLDLVQRIREQYAGGGRTQESLARENGLDQSMVSLIVRGKRWNLPQLTKEISK